ncbi:MAG: hypothetical protein Q9222_000291 [Ikaeria aurantiellina]
MSYQDLLQRRYVNLSSSEKKDICAGIVRRSLLKHQRSTDDVAAELHAVEAYLEGEIQQGNLRQDEADNLWDDVNVKYGKENVSQHLRHGRKINHALNALDDKIRKLWPGSTGAYSILSPPYYVASLNKTQMRLFIQVASKITFDNARTRLKRIVDQRISKPRTQRLGLSTRDIRDLLATCDATGSPARSNARASQPRLRSPSQSFIPTAGLGHAESCGQIVSSPAPSPSQDTRSPNLKPVADGFRKQAIARRRKASVGAEYLGLDEGRMAGSRKRKSTRGSANQARPTVALEATPELPRGLGPIRQLPQSPSSPIESHGESLSPELPRRLGPFPELAPPPSSPIESQEEMFRLDLGFPDAAQLFQLPMPTSEASDPSPRREMAPSDISWHQLDGSTEGLDTEGRVGEGDGRPQSDMATAVKSLKLELSTTAVTSVLQACAVKGFRVLDGAFFTPTNDGRDYAQSPLRLRPDDHTLVVPINSERHWVLAILHLPSTRISYWNSLERRHVANIEQDLIWFARSIHQPEEVAWTFQSMQCQQQVGPLDCGVHILVTALHHMAGLPMPDSPVPCQAWRYAFTTLLDANSAQSLSLLKGCQPPAGPRCSHTQQLIQQQAILATLFNYNTITDVLLELHRKQNAELRTVQETRTRYDEELSVGLAQIRAVIRSNLSSENRIILEKAAEDSGTHLQQQMAVLDAQEKSLSQRHTQLKTAWRMMMDQVAELQDLLATNATAGAMSIRELVQSPDGD